MVSRQTKYDIYIYIERERKRERKRERERARGGERYIQWRLVQKADAEGRQP